MPMTILLIHGAWLNGYAWLPWKAHFEAKGYTVLNPSWPYDERPPAELRASPDPKLKTLGQKQCLEHYENIIRGLPEKPIIIGHSLGGVFTQHLLDRGFGAVGVAIDPAPTPGVPLGPHAIVSALPVLGDPFSGGMAKVMSRKFFATRFAQTVPPEKVDEQFALIVPTPGKVYWDGITGAAGKITWSSTKRPPLLLIGGSVDLIADASMTKAIYEKQKQAASPTELKIFEGRSHWTCADPGWEGVADFALDWAVRHAA
jgi:pimeloyl-ACP methyl ester carboxylesterase